MASRPPTPPPRWSAARPGRSRSWRSIGRVARARLHQVVVGRRRVSLHWRLGPDASEVDETALPPSDTVSLTRDHLVLDVATRIQRRGGSCASRGPDGGNAVASGRQDPALVNALVRAESWRRDLIKGVAPTIEALAQKDGVQKGYARRMLRLAFLAPDLKTAILDGRTPAGLTLQKVMTEGLPDSWAEQRKWLAAA